MPFLCRLRVSLAILLSAPVLSLPAQHITHSAPMTERYGKPYVMVEINGKGPYRFIIDTGTGTDAFVSPELADELKLPATGESAVLKDPSMQGGQRVPIVLLPSITIAGVEFYRVKARRHSVTGEAGTCQGLLGFTLQHAGLSRRSPDCRLERSRTRSTEMRLALSCRVISAVTGP
jgi:hypothetical protein